MIFFIPRAERENLVRGRVRAVRKREAADKELLCIHCLLFQTLNANTKGLDLLQRRLQAKKERETQANYVLPP